MGVEISFEDLGLVGEGKVVINDNEIFMGIAVQTLVNQVVMYDASARILGILRRVAGAGGDVKRTMTVIQKEYLRQGCDAKCPLRKDCSGVYIPKGREMTFRAILKPEYGVAAEWIKQGLCFRK